MLIACSITSIALETPAQNPWGEIKVILSFSF
jgi:hypothetical protein